MITFILWNVSFFNWFTVIITWKRGLFRCLLLRRSLIIRNIFHQNLWFSWLIHLMKHLIFMRSDLFDLGSEFIRNVDISFSWIGCCMFLVNVLILITNFVNSSFLFNIHLLSLNDSCCLSNILRPVGAVLLISKIIKPFLLILINSLWSTWEKVFRTPWLTRRGLIHVFLS